MEARQALEGDRAPLGGLQRAEVRDVLAWLRLLADPQDAAAVVRALTRPPIELRQVDLARVIQLSRRRKLNMIDGLRAAGESPQVPAEGHERIARFLALHTELETHARSSSAAQLLSLIGERLDAARPLAIGDRSADGLDGLRSAVQAYESQRPGATLTELADELGAVAAPAPAADAKPLDVEVAMTRVRDELLAQVGSLGAQLGELRLDTELDLAHGVARFLELVKLSALAQRSEGQSLEQALADVNARVQAAATPLEREVLASSPLDEELLHGELAAGRASGDERSLAAFLPRRGDGLALSASDIETYRSCPLRYKYARVLRIPTAQTVAQRFGIVMHQVLERYHADGAQTLGELLALLDAAWRRSGLGEQESELLEKGRAALRRYHERLATESSEPIWFERGFSFSLGPHQIRGRVDRVDRIAGSDGEVFELIDYKTSRPRSAEQLEQDVQLALYALAAREAWGLASTREAYYYVLDDVRISVPGAASHADAVTTLVMSTGEAILAERFDPTPSAIACGLCDYRIICPAAET